VGEIKWRPQTASLWESRSNAFGFPEGCVTPNIAGLLKIMNHLRVFKLDWHEVSAGTVTSGCQDIISNPAEAIGNRLQVLSLAVDWHGPFMKL
jgi:hypothetical protein